MRLRRIDARRLPGGDASFQLEDLAPGLNIIVGPNGSGKSSLGQAIQATLFAGVEAPPDTELVTYWEAAEGTLRAELCGGVRWQRDGVDTDAPSVPSGHLASVYRLGLRDLLAPDHRDDEALANQIRIQIAGGFDLAGVRRKVPGTRHFEKQDRALQEARRSLLELRGERRRLADEERELDRLEQSLSAARAARQHAAALGRALELAALRDALALLGAEVAALGVPAAVLERMMGRELDELDRIDEELAGCAQDLREARSRLHRAEQEREAADLPEGPLRVEALVVLREQAERLRRSDDACRRLGEELAGARGQREGALRALAGDVEAHAAGSLDAAALEAGVAGVEQRLEIGERRLRAEAVLSPRSADDAEALSAELARLRRGADLLREWLASPQASAPVGVAVGVILTLVGLLAGVAGYWLHPGWYVASGLALGAVWTALLTGRAGSADRLRRADVQASWHELGLGEGETFERAVISARLARLDADLAGCERRQRDDIEAARLRRELAELDRRDARLREQSDPLRARLFIDPQLGAASVSDLLARIRDWREAGAAEAEAVGRHGEAQSLRESVVSRIAEMTGRDFGVGADGPIVLAAAKRLDDRCQAWQIADDRMRDLRASTEKVDQRAQRVREQRAELLARCALESVDDGPRQRRDLEARLVLQARHVELVAERRTCAARIKELSDSLALHPDLLKLSADEAQARRDKSTSCAEGAEEIAGRIGDIRGRIRAACDGDEHENRAARVEVAHEALLERRDELVDALVAQLILEEIEREHERQARPEVVQRARDSFARFTHQRYGLVVEHGEAGSQFRALESATQRGLALSELSDGTRMQLLLAARLAFATGAEHGAPLPLFLDEALTASDPERFRAVAEVLLDLAASGRQIFYLTCNPADVRILADVCRDVGAPEPRIIDLGRERGGAASLQDPEHLRIPETPSVPTPDGLGAAAYARELGVPRPDPFAPVESLHLFYVLRDELPLLHRLLHEARVERAGQWRMLCEGPVPEQILGPEEIRRVEEGVRVAECLLAAWRIGRGRPVDRTVLEASDAISDTFIEAISALADELGGHGDALMAALEGDRRPKRFRNEKCEELRVHLIEAGCLDESDPLDVDGLRARTTRDFYRRAGREGALELATVHRIFDALLVAIGEPPLRQQLARDTSPAPDKERE